MAAGPGRAAGGRPVSIGWSNGGTVRSQADPSDSIPVGHGTVVRDGHVGLGAAGGRVADSQVQIIIAMPRGRRAMVMDNRKSSNIVDLGFGDLRVRTAVPVRSEYLGSVP
jgi:hypothetical protein